MLITAYSSNADQASPQFNVTDDEVIKTLSGIENVDQIGYSRLLCQEGHSFNF